MSIQNVTIENNTGTINFYSAPGPEAKPEKKASVSIAAVDKYSSPLNAKVAVTPYGDDMHRVSFLLENELISQVIEQNYLTFKKEAEAVEMFEKIVAMMSDLRDEAQRKYIHSAILTPMIRSKMTEFEKSSQLHKPESDDLLIRMPEYFQGNAIPLGLLMHPVDKHFPGHEGIVKQASSLKKHSLRLCDRHALRSLKAYDDIVFSSELCHSPMVCPPQMETIIEALEIKASDDPITRGLKRQGLLEMVPYLEMGGQTPLDFFYFQEASKKAIQKMGEVAVHLFKNDRKIDFDDYDIFIFDADRTIWDGVPALAMEPPFKMDEGRTVATDSKGQQIRLKDGVMEVLMALMLAGKEIGLVSKSEKEGVDYQDQPAILLLREFGILEFFNKTISVNRKMPKGAFIPKDGRVVFIDDEIKNLTEVGRDTSADPVLADDSVFEQIKRDLFGDTHDPAGVLELQEGESPDDFAGWGDKDDIVACIGGRVMVRGVPKMVKEASGAKVAQSTTERELDRIRERKRLKEEAETPSLGYESFYAYDPSGLVTAAKQRPKPRPGYEIDHIKPKFKGGSDDPSNLQLIPKQQHKQKSKSEGSFEEGGNDRHRKLKKSPKKYKSYQKDCGEERQKQLKNDIGEKAYSKKQRDVANARWHPNGK